MPNLTRRNFLKYSLAAGTTALICGTASTARVFGANDRLRIAVAGVNGRGGSHIAGWFSFQPLWQEICATDPEIFD